MLKLKLSSLFTNATKIWPQNTISTMTQQHPDNPELSKHELQIENRARDTLACSISNILTVTMKTVMVGP